MGKWAKGATKNPGQHITDPKGFAKRRWGALKDDMSPDMPGETAEEKSLRNRQAMELSKLDEEENRRIKSMFAGGGGRKLFKNARSSSSRAGSAGSSSGTASTSSPGTASPYRPGPGYGGSGSLIP